MSSDLKHFLIIQDERTGFQEHLLDASLLFIGRDPKCDIRLTSKFVSRRQATLVKMTDDDGKDYYRIVDGMPKGKTSSNGMLVNGRKTLACDLQDRDEIVFGPQVRAIYHLKEDDGLLIDDDTMIPPSYY